MRILVAWGSKLGGTEGIAGIIGEELQKNGFEVVLQPAAGVSDLHGYDAAIIGGAIYANRWHRAARRLVARNVGALRRIPVWLFSTGPLDASADDGSIPPTNEVAVLMERVGALGHATFGGRLPVDAKGFPAEAMAKKKSGDWRNPDRIRMWAAELVRALPMARPGVAVDPPGGSALRLAVYGFVGWVACALLMAALSQVASTGIALAIDAVAAPVIFGAVAVRYFGGRGARDPLTTAIAFVALVALLDAVVIAGLVLQNFAMFGSVLGTWLPFVLIFLATWIVGMVMAMIPVRRPSPAVAKS